jgi:hypothetical protein
MGVGPRGSDAEQFILWVVGLGGATLGVSASFVVHLGYPGPAYWGYNSSGPLVITTTP